MPSVVAADIPDNFADNTKMFFTSVNNKEGENKFHMRYTPAFPVTDFNNNKRFVLSTLASPTFVESVREIIKNMGNNPHLKGWKAMEPFRKVDKFDAPIVNLKLPQYGEEFVLDFGTVPKLTDTDVYCTFKARAYFNPNDKKYGLYFVALGFDKV